MKQLTLAVIFLFIVQSKIYCQDEYEDSSDETFANYTDYNDELPESTEERAAIAFEKLENFMKTTEEKLQKALLPKVLKYVQRLMEAEIDPLCLNALMSIGTALQAKKLWAIESEFEFHDAICKVFGSNYCSMCRIVLDAMGKPSSGMTGGTVMDIGSQEQCFHVDPETFKSKIKLKMEIFTVNNFHF